MKAKFRNVQQYATRKAGARLKADPPPPPPSKQAQKNPNHSVLDVSLETADVIWL